VASIRLKFVQQWTDKRDAAAKPRYYFRRKGCKRVPLSGLPGSPDFMRAYETALGGQIAPIIGASRTKAGSIDALVVAFYGSTHWMVLSPQTRATDRRIIEKFRKLDGDKPVALLTRQHINALIAKKIETRFAANHWLRMIKTLMAFAVTEGWRKDDPAAGIKRIKIKTDGYHCWSEDEIEQYEKHFAIGSKERLALALLVYTGQRRSDMVTMGPQHIRDGEIKVRQQKTGAHLMIPLHPELRKVIKATPSGHLALLVTAYGQPFTAKGFGKWFRERCDQAGLPKHCAAHGLRKAACRRLAEAGCSANVIASISGHKSLNEVARYTKAADQARMAREGMAAITGTPSVNGKARVDKSRKKS